MNYDLESLVESLKWDIMSRKVTKQMCPKYSIWNNMYDFIEAIECVNWNFSELWSLFHGFTSVWITSSIHFGDLLHVPYLDKWTTTFHSFSAHYCTLSTSSQKTWQIRSPCLSLWQVLSLTKSTHKKCFVQCTSVISSLKAGIPTKKKNTFWWNELQMSSPSVIS